MRDIHQCLLFTLFILLPKCLRRGLIQHYKPTLDISDFPLTTTNFYYMVLLIVMWPKQNGTTWTWLIQRPKCCVLRFSTNCPWLYTLCPVAFESPCCLYFMSKRQNQCKQQHFNTINLNYMINAIYQSFPKTIFNLLRFRVDG